MKMFNAHNDEDYQKALPGITRKTLIFGEKTLMTEFHLQGGSILPEHSHPFEQTGYLVKGHMQMKIGDTTNDVHPGDSWCILADVPHSAQIFEDSVAVEVFSPRREDYMPKDRD
jgi:quercetin dioxygenase-like cupin family protein